MTPQANQVSLSIDTHHAVATITLGSSEERSITLTEARLTSLHETLQSLDPKTLKGLVILGSSPDMFTVGADVNVIGGVTTPESGAALARRGQEIFNFLDDLPLRTVAAISGPCVGGGCEMALACDFRIMTPRKSSVIGLPETKLGIIPGFGGTYRLPRVVGLPRALDIILKGKTLSATEAFKALLVDEVVSEEKLISRALEIACGEISVQRRSLRLSESLLSHSWLGRKIVSHKVMPSLQESAARRYPAPQRALESVIYGLSHERSDALRHEARLLGEMIITAECKSLVHLFFATESAKSWGKQAKGRSEAASVAVIGAGTMGAGIAFSFAKAGHCVALKDTNDKVLGEARKKIEKNSTRNRRMPRHDQRALVSRVEFLSFPSPSLKRAGLVIEAVFERMEIKKEVLGAAASQVSAECIIATNTSSLSVSEIAGSLPIPSRVVGMHFFNPVEKMPLVEIIRGAETSEETIQYVAALSSRLGKHPIVVRDVPGFLINRVLVPYLNEAAFLLEEGYSAKQIDEAALEFGMPMGPLRLLDEIGLDVAVHVAQVMKAGYGERMIAPDFAAKLVAAGRLGKKSNSGFYDYTERSSEGIEWSGLRTTLGLSNVLTQPTAQATLQDRMILHLVNEAYKCLHEGVAGEERDRAENQIDLGSVMGFGFPPFLGGVLHYAKTRGIQEIAERLNEFTQRFGERYQSALG